MDKTAVIKAITDLRSNSKKRSFKQTFDMVVNLKGIDIKKTDQQQEFFHLLPHPPGKNIKICALVGGELIDEAKKVCDATVYSEDFDKYNDKKLAKKLANDHVYFIAQANLMAKVATTFGKIMGPRGKMPNPKAGCVVPPKGQLKPLYDKLKKTIKISIKKEPVMKCPVGKEDMTDSDIADNVISVYNALIHHLPSEKDNIKEITLKLTMSAPVALPR